MSLGVVARFRVDLFSEGWVGWTLRRCVVLAVSVGCYGGVIVWFWFCFYSRFGVLEVGWSISLKFKK